MNPNVIRLCERILHATFRRIDKDGRYIFEHDCQYEVAYTREQLEEAIVGG